MGGVGFFVTKFTTYIPIDSERVNGSKHEFDYLLLAPGLLGLIPRPTRNLTSEFKLESVHIP